MWPKRKKGKARATKVKLKALQPNNDDLTDDIGSQEVVPEPAAAPVNPRSKEEEMISGVWKSKVLNNYKQNPKDSHNLLARIPTGKAAFEAGERQKNEAIKEAMIRIVDRMFDNFQNTAYEFNRVTGGSDLELAWIRPSLVTEDLSSWHETARGTIEVFAGRISTRYWTLAVRGTVSSIETYILPSDKLLGFSTSPTSFGSYLTITPESDGMTVSWTIVNKAIEPDLFPSVYRALLDGLIRFASDEAQPGELFRLEDIGIVPEAPAAPGALGYQEKDYSESPELLGQRNGRPASDSSPRISDVAPPRADRFIDDISNQVAQAAQSETDRFRQSMHAPPFGTTQGARPDSSSESGAFRTSDSAVHRVDQQQNSGPYRRVDSNPFKPVDDFNQSGVISAQGGTAQSEGEWKSVSSPRSMQNDWQQFMQNTRDSIQNQPQSQPQRENDKWNTVPGTQQLARPDAPRPSFDNMMAPPPPQNYPSYGNASDPPELLKPEGIHIPPSQISQSGVYGVQPRVNQSGAYSTQQQASPVNQSGAFSTQQQASQINPSGIFSTQAPNPMPPNAMAPGYAMQPPAPPAQMPPPGHVPPAPPHLMAPPPGMPSFPGMIQPGITQSGAHQQPMVPPPLYPPGMSAPTRPAGMSPSGMPPQAMPPGVPPQAMPPGVPPQAMPSHMVPGAPPDLQNQHNTGGHRQLTPPLQQQYSTGGQPAQPVPPPPPTFNSVPMGFSNPFNNAPGLTHQHMQGFHAPEPPPPPQPSEALQEDDDAEEATDYDASEHEGDELLQEESSDDGIELETAEEEDVTEEEVANEESEDFDSERFDGELAESSDGDAIFEAPVDEGVEAEAHEQFESAQDDEIEVSENQESVAESGDWHTIETSSSESGDASEAGWEQPTVVTEFSMVAEKEEMLDPPMEEAPSFPQESFTELPVMSKETVQRFERAREAGFVFSSEDDFIDAITVVLSTIDAQISLLTQQKAHAFDSKDYGRAEAIIKLSERLTLFKTEASEIMQVLSEEDES